MPSHTATGEWQSFEMRMRRRRVERLLVRADLAVSEGCLDAARTALDEARTLWPTAPGLDEAERHLQSAANPAPAVASSPHLAWMEFAAAASVVACIAAAAATLLIRVPNALPARDIDAIIDAPLVDPASVQPPSAQVPHVATTEPLPVEDDDESVVTDLTPEHTERVAPPAPTPPQQVSEPVHLESVHPEPVHLEPARPEAERAEPVHMDTPVATSGISTRAQPLPEPTAAPVPPPATQAPPMLVKEPAVSSTAISSTAVVSLPPQDALVRDTLASYTKAYNDLDVNEAARVWPGVDRGALARAFDALDSEQIWLGECRLKIDGSTAQAQCAGTATWKPKVGGGERTDPRSWTFELHKAADGWQIISARVQNR
jgi:hypothetical protein